MMQFNDIVSLINNEIGEVIENIDENASPQAIVIKPGHLLKICGTLYRHENTFFDMLSCITGLDNGAETGTMEVVYNLYSIPFDHSLMVKVLLSRENPVVPSLTGLWKTANWHEREAFDLLGIQFTDHPDLRRILLSADWEGHPLRKDYKHQEYYHGIKVEY